MAADDGGGGGGGGGNVFLDYDLAIALRQSLVEYYEVGRHPSETTFIKPVQQLCCIL
jgi:hypothetical protein